MALDLDSLFAVHTRAIALSDQRLQLLADNLANADTPNYKARDIDFRGAMSAAGGDALPMAARHPRHLADPATSANRARVMYRTPDQPAQDGNTVDTQRESAAVAETAVRYQATLTFLDARIRGLRNAITGGR